LTRRLVFVLPTLYHSLYRSGKTFAVSRQDWKWLYPSVPAKLKELNEKGIKVVIFTNQGGINGKNGFDASKANQIKGKIEDLIAEVSPKTYPNEWSLKLNVTIARISSSSLHRYHR